MHVVMKRERKNEKHNFHFLPPPLQLSGTMFAPSIYLFWEGGSYLHMSPQSQ